jgi:hypothetical protein
VIVNGDPSAAAEAAGGEPSDTDPTGQPSLDGTQLNEPETGEPTPADPNQKST